MNKRILRNSLLIIFIIFSKTLISQEKGLILSKYFSPIDYNASTQNWDIAEDERGLMYFANSSGILEYDGSEWRHIEVSNKSTVRSIHFDNNNILYIGAYNEFGCLTPNDKGELVYESLNYLIDSCYSNFGEIWNIQTFSDTVFILTTKYLFRYHNNKIDTWKNKGKRFYFSHKIGNSFYIQDLGIGLLEFKNDSLRLIEKGKYFSDIKIHDILRTGDDLIICSKTNGLFLYEKTGRKIQIKSFDQLSSKAKQLNTYLYENNSYHAIELSDTTFALSTINGSVIVIDDSWNVLEVINHESIGIKSPVFSLYQNKNKSLWLGLNDGISKVEIHSPFRYWNDDKGINGTLTDVAKINDYLYISTISGIYYTNSNETSDFEIDSFKPIEGKIEQSWGFLYFQPPTTIKENKAFSETRTLNFIRNKYTLLLASTTQGLFQIKESKAVLISDHNPIYITYQYKKDPSILFLGLQNGIAMLSYRNGKWKNHGYKYGIENMIRSINEDSLGNLWLSANYKGIYKITNPTDTDAASQSIEFFDTTNNLNSIHSVQILNYNDTLFFLSDNEYFTFNTEKNIFELYVLPEDTVQTENQPKEFYDSLAIYRINDERFTNGYIIDLEDPYEWFGAMQGTFRYKENPKLNYLDLSPTLIRKVSANDSIIYYGTNIKPSKGVENENIDFLINSSAKVDIKTILEYKDNSLTFFYSSPFYENESKNKFSFYLDGFDNKWSEWTTEHKKEYTNLGEGAYIFKVKSINIYGIETPVAEFKFTILPPWYRHWWAYITYITFGIILIIIIVKLYTKRLLNEKDKLEKIVIERTQEILMQKEEILVQAEHLKDANERISAKNKELEKQKWEITNQAIKLRKANIDLIKLSKVASETDNAIAIFDKDGNIEWINDGFTRMFGYTIDEFREEKFSNLVDGKHSLNIKKAIKSCISEKKSVVYEQKTKTRDKKDIWTQTTLTHVLDKDGNTLNLITIDSDITEIKLAETELSEQRDQLALSNATKNKFFRIIAHDLRNPISTLAGSTNLIFNDFDEYDKHQTKVFIGELNKLSQTTFNLLENLLDWSSTQMGDISFMPKSVDLNLIVDENIELIKRRLDQNNITLKLDVEKNSFALADENMVKTIIRNLLSNAVKFTPPNGKIEISSYSNEEYIHCVVKDSGVGIQNKDLKKLFKIDQHHTTLGLNNEKGSGLGLILCKEFVEKNGGEIKITSNTNEGTTIEFTLKKYKI